MVLSLDSDPYSIIYNLFDMKFLFLLLLYSSLVTTVLGQNDLHKEFISFSHVDSLIRIFHQQRDFDQAINYALIGLKMAKKQSIKKDSIYSEYLNMLSFFYFSKDDYENAEILMKEAIEIDKNIFGHKSNEYSQSLNNLGIFYFSNGNYAKSESLLLKSYEIKKYMYKSDSSYNSKLSIALSLKNLGTLYKDMNLYEKAESFYMKSYRMVSPYADSNSNVYLETLEGLGFLYEKMIRADKALIIFTELEKRCQAQLGTNNFHYLNALMGLSRIHRQLKEYSKAEKYLLKAKELGPVINIQPIKYSRILNDLAAVYIRQKRYLLSEKLLIKTCEIRLRFLSQSHPQYLSSLGNLAYMYIEMKQFDKAKTILYEIKDIQKITVGKKNRAYIHTINNLSDLYLKSNDLDSALYYSIKALILNSSNLKSLLEKQLTNEVDKISIDSLTTLICSSSSPSTFAIPINTKYHSKRQMSTSIAIISDILRKRVKKNQTEKATLSHYNFCKYIIFINNRIQKKFSYTQRLKVSICSREFIESTILTAIKLLPRLQKNYEDILQLIELNKSFFLTNDVMIDKAINSSYLPDSLSSVEMELKRRRKIIHSNKNSIKNVSDSIKILQQENKLNIDIQHFLIHINQNYKQYYDSKYKNTTVSPYTIQNKITHNQLFLEYYVADTNIYLFTISKDTMNLHALLINQAILTQKIKQLRNATSNYDYIRTYPKKAKKEYTETAHWFYKNLVAPALKNHPDIDQLIIVPDYTLNYIPFEVLLTKEESADSDYADMSYLLKQYSISYNYSATLFKENLEQPIQNSYQKMLAIAPSYKNIKGDLTAMRSPTTLATRDSLQDLRGALEEVNTLERYFNGTFIKGLDANEKYFKQHAGDYGIIHLAMHGLLDQERPILSSLAFSEDQDSLEDNFLEAHEISGLELSANLVVLSACETGYGKFQEGEGVLSLARSFMYAGVPALVVSLWKVEDEATADLMKAFYLNLSEGDPKDIALQKAKLSYLKEHSDELNHPYYWSSFIQLGNTLPIQLEKRGLSWYLILSMIILIPIIVFAIRKAIATQKHVPEKNSKKIIL